MGFKYQNIVSNIKLVERWQEMKNRKCGEEATDRFEADCNAIGAVEEEKKDWKD